VKPLWGGWVGSKSYALKGEGLGQSPIGWVWVGKKRLVKKWGGVERKTEFVNPPAIML